jgi:hypothetical protein
LRFSPKRLRHPKTIGATFTPDTNDGDGDGWTNYQEIVEHGTNPALWDTDGDGVKDSKDAFPLDPAETLDTDHDGTGDNVDPDDDGDGLTEVDEINIYHIQAVVDSLSRLNEVVCLAHVLTDLNLLSNNLGFFIVE